MYNILLKCLQFCIMVAVVGSNGKYQWTPNPLVAGIVGVFCALLVTVIIRDSLRLLRWLLRPLQHLGNK